MSEHDRNFADAARQRGNAMSQIAQGSARGLSQGCAPTTREPQLCGITVQIMTNGYVVQPQYYSIDHIHGVRAHIARDADELVEIVRTMLKTLPTMYRAD